MQIAVSVVLGTYNRKKFLKHTIENIRKELSFLESDSEIIVVDGGSTDGTIEWLAGEKDIILILQHNNGNWRNKEIKRKSWGYFMNLGFKCAKGKYICMISDDAVLVPGSIKNACDLIDEKIKDKHSIGGAAFYWRDIPGPDQYWVGGLFGKTYLINHGIFVKSALEKIGYIDEESYSFYYADSDLCLRLNEAGFDLLLSEQSFLEHYSHANYQQRKKNALSSGNDKTIFDEKWNSREIRINPFFDPSKGLIDYSDPHKTADVLMKADRFNYFMVKNSIKNKVKVLLKNV